MDSWVSRATQLARHTYDSAMLIYLYLKVMRAYPAEFGLNPKLDARFGCGDIDRIVRVNSTDELIAALDGDPGSPCRSTCIALAPGTYALDAPLTLGQALGPLALVATSDGNSLSGEQKHATLDGGQSVQAQR